MATIKNHTDISQSKALAEFLSIESADMKYKEYTSSLDYSSKHCVIPSIGCPHSKDVPCWSLTALLGVLSKWADGVNESGIVELSYEKETKWGVSILNCGKIKDCYADNQIDACYEMIIKLHDLNLL